MSGSLAFSSWASLSRQQLARLLREIELFPGGSIQRGKSYAASGHVSAISVELPAIVGQVRGTELYDVTWHWAGGGWSASCSCPLRVDCKHAYALACCVLAEARSHGGFHHPRLARMVPESLLEGPAGTATVGVRPARPKPPRRKGLEPKGIEPEARGESQAFQKLRSSTTQWERHDALARILTASPDGYVDLFGAPFREILSENDFDLMCWHLAREIPQKTGGWLPPEMEPYRDRPDLEARHIAELRDRLGRELGTWAEGRTSTPTRSLRLVVGLERLSNGLVNVTFDPRVSGGRLRDEPRSPIQLQQLRGAARRSPGLLSAEHTAMLELLTDPRNIGHEYTDRTALTTPVFMALLERFSGASCLAWDDAIPPDLAEMAGVVPGAPVRLDRDPVRLLPTCVFEDDGVRLELAFFWPDGRQRRRSEVVHLPGEGEGIRHRSGVVLANGEFALVIEEPPASLVHLFAATQGLPVPPERAQSTLAPLAESFPTVRMALAPRTRIHPVQAAIALDLREDDWLQIRLFAREGGSEWRPDQPVPADAAVFEYTPESRWARLDHESGDRPHSELATLPSESVPSENVPSENVPSENVPGPLDGASESREEIPDTPSPIETSAPEAPPATAPDEQGWWLEIPDPARVDHLVQWVVGTGAAAGARRVPGRASPTAVDRSVGWWLRFGPRSMSKLAESFDQRPTDCDWFATERARRMFGQGVRLRPRLSVRSSGVDWFSVSAEWEGDGFELGDADLARLRSSSAPFVKLKQGWVRRDAAAVHDEAAELLSDLGLEAGQGEQRLTLWQLAQANPKSLRALEHLGLDAEAERRLTELRERVAAFTGLPRVAPPPGFHGELRSYQQTGLDFLAYTASLGLGTILADDMGLGKTVQALAWIELMRERDPEGGPVLVVCPASVMHNWQREAAHFVPGLRVLALERGDARHALRATVPDHDLVVTNYALLRRDIEEWKNVDLRAAILDEAQNIKNPIAEVSTAVLELRARHRLALTGTPLENRALDLWSIMEFVNPGYLGSSGSFTMRFDRVDAPPHSRRLLAAKLRPVMLRRLKREVAQDLPERIEERRDSEMTPGQRQLYQTELMRARAELGQLAASDGEMKKNRFAILAALTRLRQICCHPALVGGKSSLGSGKFEAVFELLEPLLAEGHKVLLFSQFVRCLKLLQTELEERGIAHHLLTGETTQRERVVSAFQEDPRAAVFLVSLKAGGTGLNLTAASYVILFDPWWNPAVEAQAIDRTHRIGQNRTVIAYRMLMQGSIEEKIWELQERKAALVRDIFGEEGFARTLTREDIDYLLE